MKKEKVQGKIQRHKRADHESQDRIGVEIQHEPGRDKRWKTAWMPDFE